ncbi:hypothetical protein B0H15DRAFT_874520 [Mycena belliarum]|uniref:Uncharacterized protein n=1 Tax=Mycena belliarum TaxID=1033014 RepID=A0AAD6ULE3_9AGAR|nr:hypothetical protein B0H15DRAFT_874520 [Mycena belliae]
MLVLSRLQDSLSQILEPPELHTVVLLTPSGQLVSFASYPSRSKDEIRVIAGLAGEVWQETLEQGFGIVDSEVGRIAVLPVDEPLELIPQPLPEDYQPLMLLVLNSTEAVDSEDLLEKGRALASQIAKPLSKFRPHLTVRKPPPMPSAVTSPARAR